jgi:starch phosphorylase
LVKDWNKTQQRQTLVDSKRVYYLSLEFLMGRALDNAMLNIGAKDVAKGIATSTHRFSSLVFDEN